MRWHGTGPLDTGCPAHPARASARHAREKSMPAPANALHCPLCTLASAPVHGDRIDASPARRRFGWVGKRSSDPSPIRKRRDPDVKLPYREGSHPRLAHLAWHYVCPVERISLRAALVQADWDQDTRLALGGLCLRANFAGLGRHFACRGIKYTYLTCFVNKIVPDHCIRLACGRRGAQVCDRDRLTSLHRSFSVRAQCTAVSLDQRFPLLCVSLA